MRRIIELYGETGLEDLCANHELYNVVQGLKQAAPRATVFIFAPASHPKCNELIPSLIDISKNQAAENRGLVFELPLGSNHWCRKSMKGLVNITYTHEVTIGRDGWEQNGSRADIKVSTNLWSVQERLERLNGERKQVIVDKQVKSAFAMGISVCDKWCDHDLACNDGDMYTDLPFNAHMVELNVDWVSYYSLGYDEVDD